MNIKILIRKNIIIIISIIGIIVVWCCSLLLLNLKLETTNLIQIFSVTVALIVGMITASISWINTQNIINNNEKQLMIVEKYELLLELNIKLQSFKLQSKKNIFLKETNFSRKDYNNYLTLLYIQYHLKNNKKVFMVLFPKTLLNYTQFKFTFVMNLSSVLPKNKSDRILIELFKEIFKKREFEQDLSFDLYGIEDLGLINMVFPTFGIPYTLYENNNEIIKDYQKGIKLYFNELNYLIDIFNKEFEEQKLKYEL